MISSLSALILDDDKANRDLLEHFLAKYHLDIEVVASVDTLLKAKKKIEVFKPNILFLDINLGSGVDVFTLFDEFEDYDCFVIYITAYEEYALKAIKHQAFDFLLKPLSIDGLAIALEKVRCKLIEVDSFNRKLSNGIIAIPSQSRIDLVKEVDIVYFKSSGKYTEVVLMEKVFVSSRHIGEYELHIDSSRFLRVHHSFVINLNFVNYLDKSNGWGCIMMNGDHVPVSRRRKDEVSVLLGLKE